MSWLLLLACLQASDAMSATSASEILCSEKSLFSSLNILGFNCILPDIQARLQGLGTSPPHSLLDLSRVAESYGAFPLAVRLPDVDDLRVGAIVHMHGDFGHFQTFLGFEDGGVVLGNAPMPPIRYEKEFFRTQWSGNAVMLFTTADERRSFEHHLLLQKCLMLGLILWPSLIFATVWRWRQC